MKLIFVIILFIATQSSNALEDKHDFSAETWSQGRSCLICHSLKNDLPKVFPPGSRIIDLEKLDPEEKTAYDLNTSNVMCLVCHQEKHSVIAPKLNTAPAGTTLPAPKYPGTVTTGSASSTNIRVINSGANSYDCMKCHDLHNKDSLKMLKADYWQN